MFKFMAPIRSTGKKHGRWKCQSRTYFKFVWLPSESLVSTGNGGLAVKYVNLIAMAAIKIIGKQHAMGVGR